MSIQDRSIEEIIRAQAAFEIGQQFELARSKIINAVHDIVRLDQYAFHAPDGDEERVERIKDILDGKIPQEMIDRLARKKKQELVTSLFAKKEAQ